MLKPEGHPVVAWTLDVMMAPLSPVRRKVVPLARGRVLEIGVGTGGNLRWYPAGDDVTEIVALEPDPHMRDRAAHRAERLGRAITLIDADAAALPFEDESFDTIVSTFVLCTIPDARAAAQEMARVLRPDGQLLWAEHTVADGHLMSTVHRCLTPAWRHLAGGCHLDRNGPELLEQAGFTLQCASRERSPHHPLPVHWGTGQVPSSTGTRGAPRS